jgi:hypothetical protein
MQQSSLNATAPFLPLHSLFHSKTESGPTTLSHPPLPPPPPKKPPRQKGHKVDKTKPERLAKIEANLKDMDEKIAKHREARRTRLDKLPYIDRMLLSPKQQREKLKAMNSV